MLLRAKQLTNFLPHQKLCIRFDEVHQLIYISLNLG